MPPKAIAKPRTRRGADPRGASKDRRSLRELNAEELLLRNEDTALEEQEFNELYELYRAETVTTQATVIASLHKQLSESKSSASRNQAVADGIIEDLMKSLAAFHSDLDQTGVAKSAFTSLSQSYKPLQDITAIVLESKAVCTTMRSKIVLYQERIQTLSQNVSQLEALAREKEKELVAVERLLNATIVRNEVEDARVIDELRQYGEDSKRRMDDIRAGVLSKLDSAIHKESDLEFENEAFIQKLSHELKTKRRLPESSLFCQHFTSAELRYASHMRQLREHVLRYQAAASKPSSRPVGRGGAESNFPPSLRKQVNALDNQQLAELLDYLSFEPRVVELVAAKLSPIAVMVPMAPAGCPRRITRAGESRRFSSTEFE